eukprot:SAG11_NODE_2667_length_3114_cov_3.233167_3_plen_46_part_00
MYTVAIYRLEDTYQYVGWNMLYTVGSLHVHVQNVCAERAQTGARR